MVKLPRILIAAPASGHGKTMLTIGLMSALRERGLAVAPNKVGPDYIDPGYHALATGRVSRNLDPVLTSAELVPRLLLRGASTPPADIAIIEGVMGLFDGKLGRAGEGSAAHVSRLTQTPVVLCADASHTSRTIAATVYGIASYDPQLRIAGVVFNKVSSPRQAAEIADAMSPVPVPILGFIPRTPDIETPSRHLGLIPVEERPEATAQLAGLRQLVEENLDLDELITLAASAPDLDVTPWAPEEVITAPSSAKPIVAVAGGRAFTFRYAETIELLEAGGCIVVEFDPLRSPHLPEGTAGIYLGGGFPEVHAAELAENRSLLTDVAAAIADGVPTVAECAGMLYLGQDIDGTSMAGALPISATMAPRLKMGYRDAVALSDTVLSAAGQRVVGHEFHRTRISGDVQPAWDFLEVGHDGVANANVHASYLHTHWAGYPELAQRFISACHERNK